MSPRRPLIVAHRGLHSTFPENSLEAMCAAWATGVRWAECDVHESATGRLFLVHDETLDRTTDAAGPVADRIDAELDVCRLRDGSGRVTPYALPRLADVLRAVPPDGRLLIEVKSVRDHARLARDVAGRPVRVQSFDVRDLRRLAEHDPDVPLAYLVETPADLEAALTLPYPSVHLDHALLDHAMHRRLTAAGKAVGVWTVNREADMRRVVHLGVAVLITDEPVLAKRVLDELCGPG